MCGETRDICVGICVWGYVCGEHISQGNTYQCDTGPDPFQASLAWPDPFRAAAYRLEIISAPPKGSGVAHILKKSKSPVVGECK